ncbi:chymotrypsin-1-like isoform X1 [Venturia canescens]|uniref:chymotrypsin-1-like isoform X1 n=1 Tax=Venturia canescens TaxID=32260 RepID=UPI001C9C68C2|nr:chymotrypsin-1-like isoform X1 [Venturia canescens]
MPRARVLSGGKSSIESSRNYVTSSYRNLGRISSINIHRPSGCNMEWRNASALDKYEIRNGPYINARSISSKLRIIAFGFHPVRQMRTKMHFSQLVLSAATILSVFVGTNGKAPSRVVGGEDANIGEFPYSAAVFKKNKQICGGSIIGSRHILTAAHCFHGVSSDPLKEMSIVTGTNAIALGAGKTHAIKSVNVHPQYSNRSEDAWKNDIAVIALTEEIVFDMFTKPVRLPEENTPGKLRCVASGWGDMSHPKGLRPLNIRKTPMTTLSNEDCRLQGNRFNIFETHLCAYETAGVGLCSGDSGGPLVYDGFVVGIASFVLPCARGVPDVFTRVYSYVNFIHQVMAQT